MPALEERTLTFTNMRGITLLQDLALCYRDHSHQLALTGGAVRDHIMGRPYADLDLVSDASPEDTERILTRWAGAAKGSENGLGVIACSMDGLKIQVMPLHRPQDRYPDYDLSLLDGDPLIDHLSCYDVTINTGAILLPECRWLDPFGAVADIRRQMLRTPIDPDIAIVSYPPTMLRFARFAAELGFQVSAEVLAAMKRLASTLPKSLNWAVVVNLTKILTAPHRDLGLAVLRDTTVLEQLPERWRARLAL